MYSTGFQKTGSLLLYANYLDQVHKLMCPHKIPLLNEVGSSLSIPYWSTNTNFNQPSPLAMAEAKDNSVIFIHFQDKVFLSILSPSKYTAMSSLYYRWCEKTYVSWVTNGISVLSKLLLWEVRVFFESSVQSWEFRVAKQKLKNFIKYHYLMISNNKEIWRKSSPLIL